MPESFKGAIPPQERPELNVKHQIFEIANRYAEQLEGYADDEQVIAGMGTFETSMMLEAGKLRQFIHETSIDAINSVSLGEDTGEALKQLWHGKLIILTPEKSREFLIGIQEILATKPEIEELLNG